MKKLMLLAMAVGALVAFAVPSMASASTWATDGTHIVGETTKTGDNVHLTGTLSSTKGGLKISCDATANAVLWNVDSQGFGHATLTLLNQHGETEGCTVEAFNGTNYQVVPGCHVEPSSSGSNWPISTSGSTVIIEEANFKNKFSGCGGIGIPNGFEAGDSGTATGTVNNATGCIEFVNAGDLTGGTLIDGFLCPTEGKKLELT